MRPIDAASRTRLPATNDQSDSVFSFRVDGADAAPVPTGSPIDVPRPGCDAFAPVSEQGERDTSLLDELRHIGYLDD